MSFQTVQLRRCAESVCDGPFGSALKSEHYTESGARVIRLGNIGEGEWKVEIKRLSRWSTSTIFDATMLAAAIS